MVNLTKSQETQRELHRAASGRAVPLVVGGEASLPRSAQVAVQTVKEQP